MLKTRPSGGCSKKGVSIPPQPQVLRDLYKKLTNGEADVRVCARLLTKNPGLVAMLFKVARNASYRRYQPFESVERNCRNSSAMPFATTTTSGIWATM